MDGFVGEVGGEAFWSVFDTEAGVVASTKGCRMIGGEKVQPDAAGVHCFSDFECFVLIRAEDNAAEAEFGVVGQADGVVEVVIFMDGDDGPKDFFARYSHLWGDIGEHGWLDEEPVG